MNVLAKFTPIKTFVFDVDGVLTDGMLLVLEGGEMARRMNIKDGYALQLAIKKGYRVLVISGGNSSAVKERLLKLGINDVFMNVTQKSEVLSAYKIKHGLSWEEILFMGDDIPDHSSMKLVGLSCCPADACNDIKQISGYISPYDGGRGCARDVIEKVLKLNGHWELDDAIQSR